MCASRCYAFAAVAVPWACVVAERLPVVLIPKQSLVSLVVNDVVHYARGRGASEREAMNTQRMLTQMA